MYSRITLVEDKEADNRFRIQLIEFIHPCNSPLTRLARSCLRFPHTRYIHLFLSRAP